LLRFLESVVRLSLFGSVPHDGPAHRPINIEHDTTQWTSSLRVDPFIDLIGVLMKSKLIVTLLIASSASLAAPAFASGYGPAPYYRPDVGAPASQAGQSAQTLAAEAAQAGMMDEKRAGVGGDEAMTTQSGRRAPADRQGPVYRGS
jgi:hypothetical protein